MDFIASLPLEMTVNILSYLDSEDAVRCLAVSNLWREIVGAQDIYWKKACVRFGLPDYLIEEHKKCCASPAALFLAARKQRLYISGSKGVFSSLERQEGDYPCNVATKKRSTTDGFWTAPCRTQSMGSEHFLEIVYEEERLIPNERGIGGISIPSATISLGILGRINGRSIEKISEVTPDVCKSEWLRYLPRHQCIVTVSSNPSADHSMLWLKWSIPLKSRSHPSQLVIPGGPRETPTKYAACLQCSLMVQLDDHFTLIFIALDHTGALEHLHTEKVDLPHPHVPHYKVNITLIPCPSGCSTSTDTICSSHHLVLRVGQTIRIHQFATVSAPCFRFHFTQLSVCEIGRASKEPLVSSDGKLLGTIHRRWVKPAILHVWYLKTSGCIKVCEVGIYHLFPVLYALGHTYSIIGYREPHTVSVAVIATHTGEVIWKCSKSIRSIADHSPMRTMRPELWLLAVIREEWLSNVHTVSPPLVPFVVFKNFGEAVEGNLAIDGLSFQPSV